MVVRTPVEVTTTGAGEIDCRMLVVTVRSVTVVVVVVSVHGLVLVVVTVVVIVVRTAMRDEQAQEIDADAQFVMAVEVAGRLAGAAAGSEVRLLIDGTVPLLGAGMALGLAESLTTFSNIA